MKLEIGCGSSPQPGYVHLDVRDLEHVEYICNFEKEALPFQNDSLEEILSNHSIEHVSWRSLSFIFDEWMRCLIPGGRIFVRTPDLEFICKTYLEGKITSEHPRDEDFMKTAFGEMNPSWWANLKLFAGQDYPSNFHYLCFDFSILSSLAERHGFENCKRLSILPAFSPGEIQFEAYKPLSFKKKILVSRRGALGDVIMTTPIVRRLRQENPNAIIDIKTNYPDIYRTIRT